MRIANRPRHDEDPAIPMTVVEMLDAFGEEGTIEMLNAVQSGHDHFIVRGPMGMPVPIRFVHDLVLPEETYVA